MKKRIAVFTSITIIGYLTLCSHITGPALANGYDRTGAKGTSNSCYSPSISCHGSGAGPTVTITVLQGNTPVTNYSPGQVYRIAIHGSGTSNPKFGFQFAAVKGNGTSQTSVGTFSSITGMHTRTLAGVSILEHSFRMTAATPGIYDTAFNWTAPAAGAGGVTMYCTINAVDGDSTANSYDVSGNKSLLLNPVSVPELNSAIGISTYPNPVSNNIHIQIDHAEIGTYTFNLIDISGRTILTQNEIINTENYSTNINANSLNKGFYLLQIIKEDAQRTIQFVKE